jgi:hypothetical protein
VSPTRARHEKLHVLRLNSKSLWTVRQRVGPGRREPDASPDAHAQLLRGLSTSYVLQNSYSETQNQRFKESMQVIHLPSSPEEF